MTILSTAGRVTAITMDQYDITGYYNEYKFKRDSALIDVTPFGNRFSVELSGFQKGSLELKGMYNSTHDTTVHQRFGQDTDVLLALGPTGYRPMAPCVLIPSTVTKYDISAKAKDAVMLDSEFALRGAVDDGVMLFSPKTLLSSATGASASYDNGTLGGASGATTAGMAAQLHVWALTGTTPTLVVKIQDSANDSTWTDIATFSTADVPTGSVDREVLDDGNTIRRYVRAFYTLTGGGTARALVGFARSVTYS